MRTITMGRDGLISGLTAEQNEEMIADFTQYDVVRRIERWSIREFMRENAHLLTGRVLDFGAGDEPYRDLVKGVYIPFHPGDKFQIDGAFRPVPQFDQIMCNQVTQYVSGLPRMLREMWHALEYGGHLVMTFATNWDEVEESDMFRYTKSGMTRLLHCSGFTIKKCERRAEVAHGGFRFPLGYGIVARKERT